MGNIVMSYFRVNEKCNGCLACVENCPGMALKAEDSGEQRTLMHNMTRCARCGTCWRVCPQEAIEFQDLLDNRWDSVTSLKLVRCSVCGEALHTEAYAATLAAGTDGVTDNETGAYCPHHRPQVATLMQAHFPGAEKAVQK